MSLKLKTIESCIQMIPNEKVMLASDLADKIADFQRKVGKHDMQVLHSDSLSRHQGHSGKKIPRRHLTAKKQNLTSR
jgi:hypothetical protein